MAGRPRHVSKWREQVATLGHFVSIYTTNLDGPIELDMPLDRPVVRDGVEIRFFPIQYPRFWATSSRLARALRKDIRGYDIVHIHTLYLFHSAIAAHYSRKYNVPYLIRPHGTLDPFLYRRHRLRKSIVELLFENRNIKNASAIHFTTDQEKILLLCKNRDLRESMSKKARERAKSFIWITYRQTLGKLVSGFIEEKVF